MLFDGAEKWYISNFPIKVKDEKLVGFSIQNEKAWWEYLNSRASHPFAEKGITMKIQFNSYFNDPT